MNTSSTQRTSNQQGIVSISVAVVFIMVISLVVLGFSQVSRRNSRSALDRQLSSQAYYAAESGVNDVKAQIAKFLETGQPIPAQDDCKGVYTKNNGDVRTSAEGNRYTCLLVNPTPKEIVKDSVSKPVVIPLNAGDGALDTNTITWKPTRNAAATATIDKCPRAELNRLPNSAEWSIDCKYGLMRIDLMPADTDTIANPTSAARNTMTLFLFPSRDATAPTITYDKTTPNAYGSGAPQGLKVNASCNETECKAIISGLNFSGAYLRMQSLYASASQVVIDAKDETTFERSQVVIDVTGKSQDVLRRIQVRASITGTTTITTGGTSVADFAMQSAGSICKRYVAAPTNAVNQSMRYTDYSGC